MSSSKSLSERHQAALDELDEVVKDMFMETQGYLEGACAALKEMDARILSPATSDEECVHLQGLIRRVKRIVEAVSHHALPELVHQLELIRELRKSQKRFLTGVEPAKNGPSS